MTKDIVGRRVKPLVWRTPTDHPQDNEDAELLADGLGGRYAITEDGLLWDAADNFSFTEHRTIEAAKAAA